jgi:hypothetical protein
VAVIIHKTKGRAEQVISIYYLFRILTQLHENPTNQHRIYHYQKPKSWHINGLIIQGSVK